MKTTNSSKVWVAIGVALLLLVTGIAAFVYSIHRSRQADIQELQAWFAEYQLNTQERRFDRVVADTGPRTQEWMRRMIEAAIQDSEEQLLNRDLFDILTIMSLRAEHSSSQLEQLTVLDALKRRYSESDDPDSKLMELSDVRIEDTGATARITQPETPPGSSLFLGEGRFFTRVGGQWRFESYLLERNILLRVASHVRTQEARRKLVEDSISKATSEPFDPTLWLAPRGQ